MKRTLLITVALLALFACATFINRPGPVSLPGTITLEAQTLPISATVMWDANPISDYVTNYVVRLDGVVIGYPKGTSLVFSITTLGTHTVSVRAAGIWAESPDAILPFNVGAPKPVTGLSVKKTP